MRKIYTNGNIYTVTNGNAEAFVEEEGKFIYGITKMHFHTNKKTAK